MLQTISWLLLAVIHLLPGLAALRPALIATLYGVEAGSPVFLLLHHRAALFLAVLVVCIWAAFDPGVRKLASVVVGISMISFLILFVGAGSPPSLRTIAIADLIGLPFLALVARTAFCA